MSAMSAPVYDADYFIRKFGSIPENKWVTRQFNDKSGKSCALGHCGFTDDGQTTAEGNALSNMFSKFSWPGIVHINDGVNWVGFPQKTPKKRVLAALQKIKKMESE